MTTRLLPSFPREVAGAETAAFLVDSAGSVSATSGGWWVGRRSDGSSVAGWVPLASDGALPTLVTLPAATENPSEALLGFVLAALADAFPIAERKSFGAHGEGLVPRLLGSLIDRPDDPPSALVSDRPFELRPSDLRGEGQVLVFLPPAPTPVLVDADLYPGVHWHSLELVFRRLSASRAPDVEERRRARTVASSLVRACPGTRWPDAPALIEDPGMSPR